MSLSRKSALKQAFTLVELLVVIAIIGVLVALLLPAVQAAREAARRVTCANQVRQMGLAILNFESSNSMFPSGGIEPWPRLEQYVQGGKALGPPKQGLSWAFQILPYLEENAVHNISTTDQIAGTPVSMYFCPTRRQPSSTTDSSGKTYWLMDYAALVPIPSRNQITGNPSFDILLRIQSSGTNTGCILAYAFWGTKTYRNDFNPQPAAALGAAYTGFWGVIIRSSYLVDFQSGQAKPSLGYGRLTTFQKIKDGSSKTAMVGEKRLRSDTLNRPGVPDDDRGWSDGYDIDGLRSTGCIPMRDGLSTKPLQGRADWVTPGSAHTGGMNVVFADGSTRFIDYDIDLEIFNSLGHRSDGQQIGVEY